MKDKNCRINRLLFNDLLQFLFLVLLFCFFVAPLFTIEFPDSLNGTTYLNISGYNMIYGAQHNIDNRYIFVMRDSYEAIFLQTLLFVSLILTGVHLLYFWLAKRPKIGMHFIPFVNDLILIACFALITVIVFDFPKDSISIYGAKGDMITDIATLKYRSQIGIDYTNYLFTFVGILMFAIFFTIFVSYQSFRIFDEEKKNKKDNRVISDNE